MKTYTCTLCGKKFEGRLDRCPRCGKRLVYSVGDKHFNAEGDELVIKNKHIVKIIPNPRGPRQ